MCDCHEILALLKGSSLLAGNKKACLQVLGDAIPSYVSFFFNLSSWLLVLNRINSVIAKNRKWDQ